MNYQQKIEKAAEILQRGGLILYPTDTIWGIGCDATNELAVAKVYDLKQRNEKKSMIILLAGADELNNFCKPPSDAVKEKLAHAASPLTIIYPDAKNLAKNLINNDGTIAIRIVKDHYCAHLIRFFGKPVVSTSANISGQPFPENFKKIDEKIKAGVDLVVDINQDEQTKKTASKILKWFGDDDFLVIRE